MNGRHYDFKDAALPPRGRLLGGAGARGWRREPAGGDPGRAGGDAGLRCAELSRLMQGVVAEAGYRAGNVGRFGHGLGMQLTEWPLHSAAGPTVIRAGMVITLEPGLEIEPGRGMVHEANQVVREDGAQLLSRRAPPELLVI